MSTIASHRMMKIVCNGLIFAAAAFSSSSAPTRGADLFDAPGPGYRQQSGVIRRLDLLDALPTPVISPATLRTEEARFLRMFPALKSTRETAVDLSWLESECRRLNESLPDLPTENVFAAPFNLFGPTPARPSSSSSGIFLRK